MKAAQFQIYGPPEGLKIVDLETPKPKEDQVLIKVHAVSLNAADAHLLRGEPFLSRLVFGLFEPKFKTLGADIAGTVEAIGKNITNFKVGDEVFGDLSENGFGGLAGYVCAKEKTLSLKPANISFAEAAAIPMAAVTALQALRNITPIQAGQKVLINGASGGVGTFAVQIAKTFGAHITAVCSTSKIDLARSLGADHVIDYTKEDFTQNGIKYDFILAVNGDRPLSEYLQALTPSGTFVVVGGSNRQLFQTMLLGPFKSIGSHKKNANLLAMPNTNDLTFIKELIETGKIKPVLDKTYSLNQIVEAFQYFESGRAKGKIIININ